MFYESPFFAYLVAAVVGFVSGMYGGMKVAVAAVGRSLEIAIREQNAELEVSEYEESA